jgi:hypothetical protein
MGLVSGPSPLPLLLLSAIVIWLLWTVGPKRPHIDFE